METVDRQTKHLSPFKGLSCRSMLKLPVAIVATLQPPDHSQRSLLSVCIMQVASERRNRSIRHGAATDNGHQSQGIRSQRRRKVILDCLVQLVRGTALFLGLSNNSSNWCALPSRFSEGFSADGRSRGC